MRNLSQHPDRILLQVELGRMPDGLAEVFVRDLFARPDVDQVAQVEFVDGDVG